MADDTNTAERDAFEKWVVTEFPSIDLTREDDGYYKSLADEWWTAFKAGRASLAASAGGEPVGEVESSLRFTGGFHVRLYRGATMPEPGTKLYTHPSSPEGMAGWISVDERLPEPGQNVAFVVRANICGSFRLLNGRVLGGRFLPGEGFSIPGLCVDASHWMPLPAPPLPASEAKELR